MKQFQANTSFYDENYESYSSNDEFNLAKRVQITNELPPQDMYDMSHSLIKNDLWKWFFGSSYLSYDIQYNENTNGKETIDKNGEIKEATISKYVNGIRAKNYGPKPRYIWNSNYKDDYKEYINNIDDSSDISEDDFKYKIEYPTYHRIEIDGALLPEVDLFLHEIYRYLGVLYPDHPDYNKLLTNNEFNDEILQAGYLIDYKPDFTYFEWLSKYLDYSNLDQDKLDIYYENEAAKLKIRNLLNYATNRKFFGSKTGIKMFGSEVFQHLSIYPAAYYIPYESSTSIEYDNLSKDNKWFVEFYKNPSNFIYRNINKNHVLYKKLFRLIDWTNESYDFLNRYKEPAKFYGTAYPTPYSQFDLYEYPNQRILDNLDIKNGLNISSLSYTIADDFKAGQKIKVNGQENNWTDYISCHISYIEKEVGYDVVAQINDNEKSFIKNTISNKVVHIAVDSSIQPIYTELKVFPSIKQLINKIIEHDNLEDILKNDRDITTTQKQRFRIKWTDSENKEHTQDYLNNYYNSYSNLNDCLKNFYKIFYGITENLDDRDFFIDDNYEFSSNIIEGLKSNNIDFRIPKVAKFILDPKQDGCLYMAPQQFLTTFVDTLNISLNMSEWYDLENKNPVSSIVYGQTNISNEGFIQKGDIIIYENEYNRNFASIIVGISNAYFQFSLSGYKTDYDTIQNAVNEANDAANSGISKYGLVIKLSDNNPYAGGKYLVVFGTPHFSDATEINGKFISNSVYFDIKAIPRIKTHPELLAIYSNFQSIANKKTELLNYLIGEGIEDTYYNKCRVALNNLQLTYSFFKEKFDNLYNAKIDKTLLYGDSRWVEFIDAGNSFISSIEFRHNMFRILNEKFNLFIDTYNVKGQETNDNSDSMLASYNEIANLFAEYYTEIYNWLSGEIAIIIDDENYANINKDTIDFDYKTAYNQLLSCDNTIFNEMLPNRAFLLSPTPDDLLMRNLNECAKKDSSYSLLDGQDKFVSILKINKNEYDDMLIWEVAKEFGSEGVLTNCLSYSASSWNLGSLNTSSICASYYDENTNEYVFEDITDDNDFLNEKYLSAQYITDSSLEDPTAEEFNVPSLIYYKSINNKLQELIDNDSESFKFAYADPNFLEIFLPDNKKNNIQGELLTFNKVKINCHFIEGSNEITFEEEAAIEAMQYLSTGDQVIGKSIADDTFIEDIDIDNHKITVTNEMYITDEAILTFLCKIQYEPDSISEDFYNYRIRASRKLQAEQGTLFAHNPITDFSQFMLTPPIDLEEYRKFILSSLQEQTDFRYYFNKIVKDAYSLNNEDMTVPSTPNAEGNMIIDINAYNTFDDGQYIISQKMIDYVYQYLDSITRISDNTSLGISINGYTYYGNNNKDQYINSTFVLTKMWDKSLPFYVKIGTGLLDLENSEDEETENSSSTGAVYNISTYNNDVYSTKGQNTIDDASEDEFEYKDIDNPLFKNYLGEYEIYKNINFGDNDTYTAIQFTIMKRIINNLKINITGQNLYDNLDIDDVLSQFTYNTDGFKIIDFLGNFTLSRDENNDLILPKYEDTYNSSYVYYYNISDNFESYQSSGFLISENSKFVYKQFYYMGIIGNYGTTNNIVLGNSLVCSMMQQILEYNKISIINNDYDSLCALLSKNFDSSYCFLFKFYDENNSLNMDIENNTVLGLIENSGKYILCIFKKSYKLTSITYNKDLFKSTNALVELNNIQTNLNYSLVNNNNIEYDLNNYTNVIKGTFSSYIKLIFPYESTGFLYDDDNEINDSEEISVDLTYNYLYPDETNKTFYTYNKDDNNNIKKVAIKMENNKYYKNIINNIVAFSYIEQLDNKTINKIAKISPVEGFSFNGKDASLNDKILSIQKVNLRSDYDSSLESTMFSNYTSFKGYFKYFDITNSEVILSYKTLLGPSLISKIQDFSYELNKLRPSLNEEIYQDNILTFTESYFNNNVLYSPSLSEYKTYDEDDVNNEITFYKNRLLLVGYINSEDTSIIEFYNSNALKGLDYLNLQDTLKDTAILDDINGTLTKKDESNEDFIGVGYKNNIFYEFYKNNIKVTVCDDLNNLKTDSGIYYTDNNNWEFGNIISVAWDSDYQHYVFTSSNDENKNTGIYYVNVTYTNTINIIINSVYSNSDNTSIDLDTTQLIKIADKRFETNEDLYQTDYTEDEKQYFLARDISFNSFNADIASDNTDYTKVINQDDFIVKDLEDSSFSDYEFYKIVSFTITPGSDKFTSAYLSSNTISSYYIFDFELDRWVALTIDSQFYLYKYIKNDTNLSFSEDIEIIICKKGTDTNVSNNGSQIILNGRSYLEDNNDNDNDNDSTTTENSVTDGTTGQFLWYIPRPKNDNKLHFVVVSSNAKFDLQLNVKDSNSSADDTSYKITNVSIKSESKVSNSQLYNITYENDDISKDYNRELFYKNYFYSADTELPVLVASNDDGYMAALNGNNIFIKSEKKQYNLDYSSSMSTQKYWTKASIPKMQEFSYEYFNSIDIDELYNLVSDQLELYLSVNNITDINSAQTAKDKVLYLYYSQKLLVSSETFINDYEKNEDYLNGIYLYGIKYENTSQGRIPIFAIKEDSLDSSVFTQYNLPMSLSLEGGKTTTAYILRQTYVNYLRDFFEIALGCKRLKDFTESLQNVKSFKVTDSSIEIITSNSDVLELPLAKTYSRDAIENSNNWIVKSIVSEMEIPYYTDNDNDNYNKSIIGYIVDDDQSWDYQYKNSTAIIKKCYSLEMWHSIENIKILAGSFDLLSDNSDDNSISIRNQILENLSFINNSNNSSTGSIIAYSEDSGETYKYVAIGNETLLSIYIGDDNNIYIKTDSGLTAISISREDAIYSISNITYKSSSEFKYSGTNWISTGYLNSANNYLLYNDKLYLKSLDIISYTGSVISKTSNSITLKLDNDVSFTSTNSSSIKALLSFDISTLIDDQSQYLDYSSDLIDNYGILKVEKYSKVDNFENANLAYSYNECVSIDENNSNYYPCVAKDIDSRNVYEYNITIDSNGNKSYSQVDMTNRLGQYIYLIDISDNTVLFEHNPASAIMKVEFENLYSDSTFSIKNAARMASIKDDYQFIFDNSQYNNNLIKINLDNFYFKTINFSNKTISFYEKDFIKSLNNIISSSNINEYFYIWPSEIVSDIGGSLSILDTIGTLTLGEWIDQNSDDSNNKFLKKLASLQNTNGYFTPDALSEYFGIYKKEIENKIYYIVTDPDNTNKLAFNENIIYMVLSLKYKGQNSEQISFENTKFYIDNNIISNYNENPINAIYLNPLGYGGLLSNEDFIENTPNDLDSVAFNDKVLLKNTYGEYVYLCDENGNNILSKKGLFILKQNEKVDISYDTLLTIGCNKMEYSVASDFDDYGFKYSYNFYKIEDTPISIYAPCDYVAISNNKVSTILRLYKDNIDISSYINDKYSINVLDKNSSQLNFTYDNSILECSDIDTDTIIVSVTDLLSGDISTKTLYISESAPQIKNISLVRLTSDFSFISTEAKVKDTVSNVLTINFYNESLSFEKAVSKNIILKNISNNNTSYNFNILGILDSNIIKFNYNNIVYDVYLDYHILNPKIYYNNDNKTHYYVYDGCEMLYDSNVSYDSNIYGTLYKHTTISNNNYFGENFESLKFVFANGDDSISIENNSESNLIIYGIYGNLILNVPTYNSFKDLISSEGRIITKEIIYSYKDGLDTLKLSYVNNEYIYLDKLYSSYYDDDGSIKTINFITDIKDTDYFKIKIMPIKSILIDTKYLNNSDYFEEVPITEIDTFSYDRVWINEDVYLPPVVKIDETTYNTDNFSQYSTSLWKNKDNISVYLCNSFGKFYKQNTAYTSELKYTIMGDDKGNCSTEKYQSVDLRINPYELIDKTSYDLFYNKYYSPNEKCNPFIKYLYINDINNKNEIRVNYYSRIKENGNMTYKKDDSLISDNFIYEIYKNKYIKNSILDYENGILKFIIQKNNVEQKETLITAGIKHNNPLLYSTLTYKLYGDFSFSTTSVENPSNKEKNCVVDITEMGIFDKNDNLLAYMTHPIAQYDTSKNHISYNLLIKEN